MGDRKFIQVGSALFDPREVTALVIDDDTRQLHLYLESGSSILFKGKDADLVWDLFDPDNKDKTPPEPDSWKSE